MEIDQVLLVREAERRQRRDGGEYLRLQLGDRTGAVACMVWEELAEVERARPRRRAGARARPLHGAPALRRRRSTCAGSSRPSPGASTRGAARRPRARGRADGGRGPRAARDDPGAAPARSCSSACSARAPSCGPATAWRRRPSTTTRPTATACSSTASASPRPSARSARRSRASTATSRSPARCCTTSASSRPTPTDRAADIDLTDAGRLHGEIALGYYRIRRVDRGHRGLPRGARAGGRAHHPLPPRLARARQPGGAVHARGDARAHDRQPRRAPGQLRSPREGARARRGAGRASTARSAAARSSPSAAARPRGRAEPAAAAREAA